MAETLDQLKQEYSHCERCPELVKTRTNVVFGVGDPRQAKVLIIGEAPGRNEDLRNEPFVGRSGQILNSLLDSVGLGRKDVYITNTILCRPPNNRDPTPQELANCKERLDTHIRLLNPKVVITLGNFATKYMLDTKTGISKLRGKIHHKDGRTILPMFHPAALIYSGNNPEKRKTMESDFQQVAELLGLKKKEQKSISDF